MEIAYTEYGKGEYVASEAHVGVRGRSTRAGVKRGVIGIGGFAGLTLGYLPRAGDAVLAAGSPWIYGDLVDNKQWGNATCTSRIASLFTFAQTRLGFKTDKVLLSAGSHGTACALNYALANPTKVAAMTLALPAVDIKDIHDNSRASSFGATPTQMEGVHGGSLGAFNTAMATLNPVDRAAELNGIPILMFYSSDDPVCIASRVTAFAAACASSTAVNMGAFGHGTNPDPSYGAMADDFLKSYA